MSSDYFSFERSDSEAKSNADQSETSTNVNSIQLLEQKVDAAKADQSPSALALPALDLVSEKSIQNWFSSEQSKSSADSEQKDKNEPLAIKDAPAKEDKKEEDKKEEDKKEEDKREDNKKEEQPEQDEQKGFFSGLLDKVKDKADDVIKDVKIAAKTFDILKPEIKRQVLAYEGGLLKGILLDPINGHTEMMNRIFGEKAAPFVAQALLPLNPLGFPLVIQGFNNASGKELPTYLKLPNDDDINNTALGKVGHITGEVVDTVAAVALTGGVGAIGTGLLRNAPKVVTKGIDLGAKGSVVAANDQAHSMAHKAEEREALQDLVDHPEKIQEELKRREEEAAKQAEEQAQLDATLPLLDEQKRQLAGQEQNQEWLPGIYLGE